MALATLRATPELTEIPTLIMPLAIDDSGPTFTLTHSVGAHRRERLALPSAPKALLASCPCHPQPQSDELFSSWLVRLAAANHSKLHTFCTRLLPRGNDIWARDFDRSASHALLQAVAHLTAQPKEEVWKTTLRSYEGNIFPRSNVKTASRYFLPQGVYHRTRRLYGLMYCPRCLADDEIPYYRRSWRVTLVTVCVKHGQLLRDRCPHCELPINFFRQELGHRQCDNFQSISSCYHCQAELRLDGERDDDLDAIALQAHLPALHATMIGAIQKRYSPTLPIGATLPDFLNVVQRVAQYLTSAHASKPFLRFQEQLRQRANVDARIHRIQGPFGRLPIYQRHLAVSMALWLLTDWPARLYLCGDATMVGSSDLLRYFVDAPDWFKGPILRRYYRPIMLVPPSYRAS